MIIQNNKRILAFADTHGHHRALQVPEPKELRKEMKKIIKSLNKRYNHE